MTMLMLFFQGADQEVLIGVKKVAPGTGINVGNAVKGVLEDVDMLHLVRHLQFTEGFMCSFHTILMNKEKSILQTFIKNFTSK